ncbi:hypothetical protein M2140_002142, partial [Clostridiales Family XIII bacterium PM5-7]
DIALMLNFFVLKNAGMVDFFFSTTPTFIIEPLFVVDFSTIFVLLMGFRDS